jgi:hypothetical protein
MGAGSILRHNRGGVGSIVPESPPPGDTFLHARAVKTGCGVFAIAQTKAISIDRDELAARQPAVCGMKKPCRSFRTRRSESDEINPLKESD